ncbi:hypothetical protein ACHAWF_018783 [Thalassiosira exigua]
MPSPMSIGGQIEIGDEGYEFMEEFNTGWFKGKVTEILAGEGNNRRCIYDDGDSKDLRLEDLRELAMLERTNYKPDWGAAVPKEGDIVLSLDRSYPEYSEKLKPYLRGSGAPLTREDKQRYAKEILKKLKNETKRQSSETRLLKKHRHKRTFFQVDDEVALKKIASDLRPDKLPSQYHIRLRGHPPHHPRLCPDTEGNNQNRFFFREILDEQHIIIGFERNESFDTQALEDKDILEIIGQFVAKKFSAEPAWTIRAETARENNVQHTCYKDVRRVFLDEDTAQAEEGVNKFTGYPALARLAYKRGFYKSDVVESEDGIAFLTTLKIAENPYLIFEGDKKMKTGEVTYDGSKSKRGKKHKKPHRRISGWILFCSKFRKENGHDFATNSTLASDAWREMSKKEREPYVQDAKKINDRNFPLKSEEKSQQKNGSYKGSGCDGLENCCGQHDQHIREIDDNAPGAKPPLKTAAGEAQQEIGGSCVIETEAEVAHQYDPQETQTNEPPRKKTRVNHQLIQPPQAFDQGKDDKLTHPVDEVGIRETDSYNHKGSGYDEPMAPEHQAHTQRRQDGREAASGQKHKLESVARSDKSLTRNKTEHKVACVGGGRGGTSGSSAEWAMSMGGVEAEAKGGGGKLGQKKEKKREKLTEKIECGPQPVKPPPVPGSYQAGAKCLASTPTAPVHSPYSASASSSATPNAMAKKAEAGAEEAWQAKEKREKVAHPPHQEGNRQEPRGNNHQSHSNKAQQEPRGAKGIEEEEESPPRQESEGTLSATTVIKQEQESDDEVQVIEAEGVQHAKKEGGKEADPPHEEGNRQGPQPNHHEFHPNEAQQEHGAVDVMQAEGEVPPRKKPQVTQSASAIKLEQDTDEVQVIEPLKKSRFDYFQVFLQKEDTQTVIRVERRQNVTFIDLREQIEEDCEGLPPSFRFTLGADGCRVTPKQERKWYVMSKDFDLTHQGDGSVRKPYCVYIVEAD